METDGGFLKSLTRATQYDGKRCWLVELFSILFLFLDSSSLADGVEVGAHCSLLAACCSLLAACCSGNNKKQEGKEPLSVLLLALFAYR